MRYASIVISVWCCYWTRVGGDLVTPCPGVPDGKYSAPNDLLQAKDYAFTPKNPRAGDTIIGSFSGVMTEDITGGVIAIDVKLSDIVPIRTNLSLSLIDNIKLPIRKGPFSLSETATLPGFLFGHVKGIVRIISDSGKQIACVKLDLELGD